MSSSEARKNMARAGTMQATSKEGMSYLQKNLPTHWKHINQLKVHFAEENESKTDGSTGKKRPASSALKKNKQPAAKKPKLTKTRTMAATAKEGAILLGNEILGDTRQTTRKAAKAVNASKKRAKNTKAKRAVAKAIKTKATRNKATKKASKKSTKSSLKKANTMVNTAKEGKAYINRGGTKLPSKRCTKTS